MNKQPDILVFMSDQHGADYVEWGGIPVDTPSLDAMRQNGTSFDAAYSSCPLCVPARMSMMSGLLPSRTGIFTNNDTLPDMTPCFTHALVAAGYETVLIGRMHFIGKDQRHGFTKRLAPDLTPVSWVRPMEALRRERGILQFTTFDLGATEIVGAGESFVEHYDCMVVDSALRYLSEPHDKPQFILVGTYGPHFPYVTSEALFQKYLDRVQLPAFFSSSELPDYMESVAALRQRVKGDEVDKANARACLAAYCGQIERMDGQIGELRNAFAAYGRSSGRDGIMAYISDHGDTAGERRMYGKRSFFDKSVKVPMLFEGFGIPQGKQVASPVSLMDIGPTVCELAETSFDLGDGKSLTPFFCDESYADEERLVTSQIVEKVDDAPQASVMFRWKHYKYIMFHDENNSSLLFDLADDPLEAHNLLSEKPELAVQFAQAIKDTDFADMERLFIDHARNSEWFKRYEEQVGLDDSERWKDNPPTARGDLAVKAVYRMRPQNPGQQKGW